MNKGRYTKLHPTKSTEGLRPYHHMFEGSVDFTYSSCMQLKTYKQLFAGTRLNWSTRDLLYRLPTHMSIDTRHMSQTPSRNFPWQPESAIRKPLPILLHPTGCTSSRHNCRLRVQEAPIEDDVHRNDNWPVEMVVNGLYCGQKDFLHVNLDVFIMKKLNQRIVQ